jgi:hypothetical protein
MSRFIFFLKNQNLFDHPIYGLSGDRLHKSLMFGRLQAMITENEQGMGYLVAPLPQCPTL